MATIPSIPHAQQLAILHLSETLLDYEEIADSRDTCARATSEKSTYNLMRYYFQQKRIITKHVKLQKKYDNKNV